MRQTLNIPGIKYENIEEVNKYIKNYIHDIEVEMCDVDMDVNEHGYSTIGARNIMSCIGAILIVLKFTRYHLSISARK